MLSFNTNIPRFFNNYNTVKCNSNNSRYSNLSPLKYDTVSFRRTVKNLPDTTEINGIPLGISIDAANELIQEAEVPKNYLKFQLDSIFSDMISSKDNHNNVIKKIDYRIKEGNSIVEKSKTRRWFNKDEVKSSMTDIVGARIVLNDASMKNVDEILSRIAAAENDGKLRIKEIENYRPEPEIDENGNIIKSYDYGSTKSLRQLKQACDKKGSSIPKRDEDVPAGYMAIHILTELPNGFTGEIQIMGKNVAELKDIEDICYKYKSGKEIKDKYKPMTEKLEPLSHKDDILLHREFNKYTREAYICQRNKETGKNKSSEFLKIPDYLPPQLDFNNLSKIKNECDKN